MEFLQARERADRIAASIRNTIRAIDLSLESVRRFFAGSEEVTSQEFREFTAPMVREYPIEFIARWSASDENDRPSWKVLDQVVPGMDPHSPLIGTLTDRSPWLASWLETFERTELPDFVAGVAHPEEPGRLALGIAVQTSRPTTSPPEVVTAVVNLQRLYAALRGSPGFSQGLMVVEIAEDPSPDASLSVPKAQSDPTRSAWAFIVPIGAGNVPLTFRIRVTPRPTTGLSLTDLAMGGSFLLILLSTMFVGWVQRYGQRLEHEVAIRTQELRESQEKLQVTLDSIQEAVIATGPDGRIQLMNPAAEKMTGRGFAAAKGLAVDEVIPLRNKDGTPAQHPVREVLRERRAVPPHEEAHVLSSLDGTTRYVEDTATPIRDPSTGEVLGSVLLLRDVTSTYAIKQQLWESERRFRLLFENMLDACIVFDVRLSPSDSAVDFRCVAANPALERLVGRSGLVGASLGEIFTDLKTALVEPLCRVARTGESVEFEAHHRSMGRHFVVCAYPLEPHRLAVILEDITDRKRAEEELVRSHQLLYDVLETIQDGVSLLDRELNIRYVNSAMRRWYADGRDPIGRKCYELYHRRERPCEVCPALRCLNTGHVETEIVPGRGDSSVEWLEVFTYPMRDPMNGEVVGVVEFVRDITAHRKAEEERRRMQDRMLAVQRLESLGVLAGGIAHDFNNILMAILGNADLAKHELPLGSPAREHIIQIEVASRRAAELCRQMLAYAGQGRFVVEVVDLNELISEMVQLLTTSISKRVRLNLQLEPGIPPIRADASQIRQVVMNLVVNASEAIGDRSGTISITTGAVDCDRRYLAECSLEQELPEGLYVKLEVADTGCGMDRATMARIFDPFFTTKFTGRGLGLSAVLGIVRGHKGAIRVYSEPGKGSVFKLLFPACLDASPQRPGEGAAESWRGGGLVLLVDDDESVRALGKRMLERLGFEVVVGSDGREAVELFAQHRDRIRVVVLDLTMPGMSGEDVFRSIRAAKPDARVVLASGYSADELASRLSAKGYAGFLQKPYTIEDLTRVLKSILT
jgi:PAS domain S-box-containing protein